MAKQYNCETPFNYSTSKLEGILATADSSSSLMTIISAITILEEDFLPSPPSPRPLHQLLDSSFVERPREIWNPRLGDSGNSLDAAPRLPSSRSDPRFSSCSDRGRDAKPCVMPRRKLSVDDNQL